ncbi:MAG: hypothetical protein ACI9W6_003129, partial [Motiliproteus sp.]
ATAAVAVQAQADTAITVTLVSDYVYNGVSSTDGKPALQGSADWWNDAGFYAGIWGSKIDFKTGTNEQVELDYYAGYAGSLDEHLDFDLGYAYYTYPGADEDAADLGEFDYGELYGSLTYRGATKVLLSIADDYFGEQGNSAVLVLSHQLALGNEFNLKFEGSHTQLLDSAGNASFGPSAGDDSYNHWGVSVAKSIAGFDLNLAYTDTNIDGDYWASDVADARLALSVGRTF